jgi:eukaryotic-like serine/threonine-protein kinase
VPLAELLELSREVGEVQRLIDQMVDARLLVVQTLEGGRGSTVEIVHESLVNGWPTLRRWLDENQDDAALVDQLRVAARQWHQKGQDQGLLWRGESAEEAKKFRKRYKGPLSDIERGFLDAVVRFETQQARRRRAAIIGGFTFLSMIVVAAMVLLVIIQKSRAEAKDNLAKAEVAQQEAQQNLEGMKKKERERLAEESEKRKIAAAKVVVDQKLDRSQEDLKATNVELVKALDVATDNAEQAKKAQRRAEENARAAEKAQAEALASKDVALKAEERARKAYEKEHDRAERLEKEVGKVIDTLPK